MIIFSKMALRFALLVLVASCNQVEDKSAPKSKQKSQNVQTTETVTEDGTYIESNADDETNGVMIYVPKDSTVDSKEIQVQKGASVANNTTASYLNYPGEVQEASVSVTVVSQNRFYDQTVGTLQITLPGDNIDAERSNDDQNMQLSGTRKIALFYHAYTNQKGARVYGVVPAKDLQFTDKGITFNLRGFGNYQLGYVTEEIDWSKRVGTANDIETADGQKTSDQILNNLSDSDRAIAEQEYAEASSSSDDYSSDSAHQVSWSQFTFNLNAAPNPSNVLGAEGLIHRSESSSSPDGKTAVSALFSTLSPAMAIIASKDSSNEWKSVFGSQWFSANTDFPINGETTAAITNRGVVVAATCSSTVGNATYKVGIAVNEGITRTVSMIDATSVTCESFNIFAFDGDSPGAVKGLLVPRTATYSGMDQTLAKFPTQVLQFDITELSAGSKLQFRALPLGTSTGRKFGFRAHRTSDSVLFAWGTEGGSLGLGTLDGDQNQNGNLTNCGQAQSSTTNTQLGVELAVYRHDFANAANSSRVWSGKTFSQAPDLSFTAQSEKDWSISWMHFEVTTPDSVQIKSIHSSGGKIFGCTSFPSKALAAGSFWMARTDDGWMGVSSILSPTSTGAQVSNHHVQRVTEDLKSFSITGKSPITEISEDKNMLISDGGKFVAMVTTSSKMTMDGTNRSYLNTYLIDPTSSTFTKQSQTVDRFCGNSPSPTTVSTTISCSNPNADIIRLGNQPGLFLLTWPSARQIKILRLN